MGSGVSHDREVTTPCWTNSQSSHEAKAGNGESRDNRTGKKKANCRVKWSSTGDKLRVRGSKGNHTSWSLEIVSHPADTHA